MKILIFVARRIGRRLRFKFIFAVIKFVRCISYIRLVVL